MSISMSTAGGFYVIWVLLAIPTIVYLAGRKTSTKELTMFWGIVASLLPPVGLLFILALLLKNDQ